MVARRSSCYSCSVVYQKRRVDDIVLAESTDVGTTPTLDMAWGILCWSFAVLESGKHPTRDHRGELFTAEPWFGLTDTDVADGLCGLLWIFRSDADYIHKDLDISGYWARNEPYYSCCCSKTNDPSHFLTFGQTSSWPTTIFLDMADFPPLREPREADASFVPSARP